MGQLPMRACIGTWLKLGKNLRFNRCRSAATIIKHRYDLGVPPYEIFAAGFPNDYFSAIVEVLRRAGIDARQVLIADYDRDEGYNPIPHPRGQEVYVLVPADKTSEALALGARNGDRCRNCDTLLYPDVDSCHKCGTLRNP